MVFNPQNHSNNAEIEKVLEEFPDLVADALAKWRRATAEREKAEGLAYMRIKGASEADGIKRTPGELRAMTNQDEKRFASVLLEIEAEANYTRHYEKLLSAKRLSALRTAF